MFTFSLGYAIAQPLGQEGETVLISSNVEKDNDEAVRKLKKLGIDTSCTFCDVSKEDDNKNLVKTVIYYSQFWLILTINLKCSQMKNSLPNVLLAYFRPILPFMSMLPFIAIKGSIVLNSVAAFNRCSSKLVFLKVLQTSQKPSMLESLCSNFIRRRLQHRGFPMKFIRTTFSDRTLPVAASVK